ncbi:MAG: hypothetical protein R3C14_02875 [Caldilineaceae bacterium]
MNATTGVFTLQPGKSYLLKGGIGGVSGGASGFMNYGYGIGVVVNGAIHNRQFWPAPNGDLSQGECIFGYRYNAGDQISVAVWSEDPVTLQSGSFHILAELLSV